MQLYCNKKLCALLASALLSPILTPLALASSPSFDLLRGHTEIQMEYDEEAGWWAGVSYTLSTSFDNPGVNDVVRIEADALEFVLPPLTRQVSGSATDFFLPAGVPIWRIPQGFVEGTQFLGLRVLTPNNAFLTGSGDRYTPIGNGNINLRLLSMAGSGPDRGGLLGTWQDGSGFAPPKIGFNTSDGIDADDEITILRPGAHTHYNWAFTQPGVYEVNMEVYGRLVDGTDTSHPFTMTFQVPHEGALSEMEASLSLDRGDWALLCRDSRVSVTYAEQHCYLHATTPSSDPTITGFEMPFTFALNNPATSDTVGISAVSATSLPTFEGGVSLTLVKHVGPGEVIAMDLSSTALVDTRDGLDASDSWFISDGQRTGKLYFTEQGIHHLSFVATGFDAGNSPVSVSRQLLMRCGANVPAGHSYLEWADSYERAYGLSVGALSDPAGNFDGDAISNQLEYLLDVAGADPVTFDESSVSGNISRERIGRFSFMRDLHKDSLSDEAPALFPSFSQDLETWEIIGAGRGRNGLPIALGEVGSDGLPFRLHERPVITGNARSLFMKRDILNPASDQDSSFFRLETVTE